MILRVLQTGAHVLGEILVLGAVGLVHDHDDIASRAKKRVRLALSASGISG